MGDYDLFRLLVAAGADINQKTSKAGKSLNNFQRVLHLLRKVLSDQGLCAIDVALLANKNGSHAHIIDFLKSDVKAAC